MNATTAARSASARLNGGIPLSIRPERTTGPISFPLTSFSTSSELVRSGPVSPPAASRPWQNAHCVAKSDCPFCACSAGAPCGLAGGGSACRMAKLRLRKATIKQMPSRNTRESHTATPPLLESEKVIRNLCRQQKRLASDGNNFTGGVRRSHSLMRQSGRATSILRKKELDLADSGILAL